MIKLKDILNEASSEKLYYHVSPREYKAGDNIVPYFDSNKYAVEIDAKSSSTSMRKIVEDILNNSNKSGSITREKSIFVFKTLPEAKRYTKDMGDSRNIYAVTSSEAIKWHDMNWVDYIFGKVAGWGGGRSVTNINQIPKDSLESIKRFADYYWQGASATKLVSGYFRGAKWEGITNNPVKVINKIK